MQVEGNTAVVFFHLISGLAILENAQCGDRCMCPCKAPGVFFPSGLNSCETPKWNGTIVSSSTCVALCYDWSTIFFVERPFESAENSMLVIRMFILKSA